MYSQKQKNGTGQKEERNGTLNTIKALYQNLFRKKSIIAFNAEDYLGLIPVTTNQSFVMKIANQHLEGTLRLMTWIENVLLAAIRLRLTNTIKENKHAKIHVIKESVNDVYDIEVEDEHEFFANNILVHNCTDSLRYFLVGAFPNLYKPD